MFYNIFADLGMYTKEELYNGYNRIGGRFGQHPNRKYIEGFEASTGSLGHGLSLAVGFAFSAGWTGLIGVFTAFPATGN